MPSKRVHDRVERCGLTVRAAFACADVVAEALGRRLRREIAEHRAEAGEPGDAAAVPGSIGVAFRAIGRAIARRCRRALAADRAYDRARAELSARRRRRDRLAARLYGRLVGLRRRCGRRARRQLGLDGPTSRDPVELGLQGFQAVRFLTRPRRQPAAGLLPGGPIDPQATAGELEPLCAELEEAVRAVYRGQAAVDGALFHQRRALRDLDRVYVDGARFLENTLDAAGLPTVRDLVRPGVGRRGRPPKVKRVDDYPDLVELALSRCAPPAATVAAGAPAAVPAVPAGAGSPEEGSSAAQVETRERREGPGEVRSVASSPPAGSRESDRRLRQLPAGGKKIDHAVRMPAAGEKEIGHALRKSAADGEKAGRTVRKSRNGDVSQAFVALNLPPAVRGCGRGGHGRDRERWRQPMGLRPAGPRAGGRSTLGRVRRAASVWWRRIRRAA